MSSLAWEACGICAEGGMKSDAFWEGGGVKSVASGKIGSEEACEEAYEEACEDDCESIRRLFGLTPLGLWCGSSWSFTSVAAGESFAQGRPESLARLRKRVRR